MNARTTTLGLLVGCFLLLVMSTPLRADISFGPGGGTLSGGFVYDATTNTFTSWDIMVTAGVDAGGNAFSALTYSNTITGDTAGPGGFNANGFFDFSFFSPTGGNGNPPFNGRTLSMVALGNTAATTFANLPAPGQTTQIQLITDDSPLASAANCFAIQPPGAIPCSVEGQSLGGRALQQPAFLNITDPPGTDVTYSLTFTNVPASGTSMPEPSSLLLSTLGLAAFALKRACS